MARSARLAAVLLPLLLSASACSAVLVSNLGTNYDDKLARGKTSRREVHERFGAPISSQAFASPREPSEIPATSPCSKYWALSPPVDPTPSLPIAGSEVFRVRGRVIVPEDHWTSYVFLDSMTLGLAEVVTTPVLFLDWLVQLPIRKDLTVYYRTDDTFAGGEIRWSSPRGIRHLVPLPWWEEGEDGLITLTPACMTR